ncbi:hypothetical protein TKK_0019421 [Trichogramma kaykai]
MSIVEHRLDLEEAKFKSLVDLLDHSFTIQADYEELLIKDRYLSITDKDREHHNLDIDDWKSRENCLERVVLQKNTICLMIESTGQLVEHAGEVLYGKKVMKLMKDCPWKLTTRLVLTKGSPYLQRINKILQYMQASGIQQTFHLEDSQYNPKITKILEEVFTGARSVTWCTRSTECGLKLFTHSAQPNNNENSQRRFHWCRSMEGGNQTFSCPLSTTHENFRTFRDVVL